MVKTYLKYQLKEVLGQITSNKCRIVISPDGKLIYTGCNEYVMIFETKTGMLLRKLRDDKNKSNVTCIKIDRTNTRLAVGYENGTISILNIKADYQVSTAFSLHRAAISVMDFSNDSTRLASGSKDNNIFIWDILGESVLYKLAGHKDSISRICYYHAPQLENEQNFYFQLRKITQ